MDEELVAILRESNCSMAQLLREFVEINDTPCRLDRKGFCQEHFSQFYC
jgi:hypothetical protein